MFNLNAGNIDNTIAPGEYVMPNALYVGVAALAGTIVARKSKSLFN